MKISLYTRVSDLIPVKETFADRADDFLFKDPKREMFKIHTLDSIFPALKKSGAEGMEVIVPKHLPKKTTETVKQISQKYELKILSIHQSHDTYVGINFPEIERLCSIGNGFSANIIVLHINALWKIISKQTFLAKLKNLQKKYGVTFAVENVAKSPFSLAKGMYRGDEFARMIEDLNLAITLDTTHLGQAGDDICEFYKNNKERIVNVHISDYKKSWLNRSLFLANKTHLPLGEGDLPIARFLRTLKQEDYKGPITMEINAGLEKLCQNAEMIRKAFE